MYRTLFNPRHPLNCSRRKSRIRAVRVIAENGAFQVRIYPGSKLLRVYEGDKWVKSYKSEKWAFRRIGLR